MYDYHENTLVHVDALAKHIHSPRHAVRIVLLELGIRPTRDGFRYLQDTVLLYRQHASQILFKTLYPEVARTCGKPGGGKQVERAIRAAVQDAWKSRDDRVWKRYFSTAADGSVRRPTNAEFIANIALVLDLFQDYLQEAR